MGRIGLGILAALAVLHLRAAWAETRRAKEQARLRTDSRPELARKPRASILVAAWNEQDTIAAHVRSATALAYPDVEYVLCAGGTDDTYERAKAALAGRGTLLRQEPGEGKQRALRRCAAVANGEIVFLTDADCLLDDLAFERTIEPLVQGAQAATGRSRPTAAHLRRHPLLFSQWAPQYVAESSVGATSAGLLGRNCAVSRDALRRTGDFSADAPTGTDQHLAWQLARFGVSPVFVRWSFVETATVPSIRGYVRQQSRWLRNHWIHGSASGSAALRRHAALTWAIGTTLVVLLPVLAILFGRAPAWAWLALVAHGTFARARYLRFTSLAEGIAVPPEAVALVPVSFLVDAVAWFRSLVDFVLPARRHAW
jgi:cellulose synthase/poly-beta-1,6-N-acetylglucosamine synthase-like glycosyltransferase